MRSSSGSHRLTFTSCAELHAAILAHLLEIPFAALAYHEKVTEFASDVGLPSQRVLHPDEFTAEELAHSIKAAIHDAAAGDASRRGRPLAGRDTRERRNRDHDAPEAALPPATTPRGRSRSSAHRRSELIDAGSSHRELGSRAEMTRRTALAVIHTPSYGGPHNQIALLARPLADAGWRYVVATTDEPGDGAHRLREAGVEVYPLKLRRPRRPLISLRNAEWATLFAGNVRVLRRLALATEADVVQVCGLMYPQGALAARGSGLPLVWQLLGLFPPPMARRLLTPARCSAGRRRDDGRRDDGPRPSWT